MKKIISLLLTLTLLVGLASVSFATPADVTDEDTAEAVNVLMALGVVDGYPDGTYKPENVVTRAEMAKLIVTNLGYASLVSGQNSSFSDMNGHWATGYVEICVGLGIVQGYPDGSFKPNNTVTYNEAATMVVRALGYTDEALGGTWPTNYVTKAMDKDIFDNVTIGVGATRGDIAKMLFNALPLAIGTVDQDGDYNEDPDDTLIARVNGSQADDAIILGTEDTTISLLPHVGVYSEIYLNNDDEVLFVKANSDVIEGDFDGTTFESDKDYTVAGSVDGDDSNNYNGSGDDYIVYFENGEATAAYEDVDALVAAEGTDAYTLSADVSGVTIKEVYSASQWNVTTDLLFSDDDAEDIDEDQELNGEDFELNDDEEIKEGSYLLVGVDSLDDIEEDDVVYVYSDSNYITKIAVGTEVVTGEVTKINSGETKFTVNSEVYELADQLSDDDESGEVSVEDEVEIKLDAYGKVYEMTAVESDKNYAVVLELGDGSGSGLTGVDPAIKLFLADGSTETFDVDYDEDETEDLFDNTDVDEWDTSEIAAGNLVEYALNNDGDIDELTVLSTSSAVKDITDKGYYDGYALASTVVAFGYDGSDATDADNYSVIEREDLIGLDDVDSDYYTDSNKIAAMLVDDYSSGTDVFGFVQDYANTADPDYEITLFVNGDEVTYGSEISGSSAKRDGELYKLDLNSAGEIEALDSVEDGIADTSFVTSSAAVSVDFDGSTIDIDGTEYTVDSDLVIIQTDSGDSDKYSVKTKRDLENSGTSDITLYDVVDNDGVYDTIVFVK